MEACRRTIQTNETAAGAALNGTREPHQNSRVGFIHSTITPGLGRFLQVNPPTVLVSDEDGADSTYPGSLDYIANGLVSEAFQLAP